MVKAYTRKKYRNPAIRCRVHPSRLHKGKPDQYFSIRHSPYGKQIEEGLGWASKGHTAKEAEQLYLAFDKAKKTGEGPRTLKEKRQLDTEKKAKQALEGMSFDDVWKRYLAWAKSNKTHWNNDEYRYRLHIAPTFGTKPANSIKPHTLENLKQQLQETLASATVKHCLVLIRQIINKALDGTLGDENFSSIWPQGNPVTKIKLPITKNEKQRVLQADEQEALFDKLREKSWTTYCFAMTSLYSGLRFAEIASLRWHHIDRKKWKINLIDGKFGLERKVLIPIHEKLQQVLTKQWKDQGSPPQNQIVFPNRNGKKVKKLSRTYARTVDDLGLNDGYYEDFEDRKKMTVKEKEKVRPWLIDFHALRHTFATRLGEHAPLPFLRDVLGHSDLKMVSRYAKAKADDAADLISRV